MRYFSGSLWLCLYIFYQTVYTIAFPYTVYDPAIGYFTIAFEDTHGIQVHLSKWVGERISSIVVPHSFSTILTTNHDKDMLLITDLNDDTVVLLFEKAELRLDCERTSTIQITTFDNHFMAINHDVCSIFEWQPLHDEMIMTAKQILHNG